ncbi:MULTISPECIES: hypothetical protein [unclassified Streptomyces]|uniref:HoxN/HupN/NixA family nickel/cobalt transporter n=1 Tax=unclassified Streptomyces TaxID=2593676 RepID=UPI00224FB87B|nr:MULTISPECIES: hypothetical protein [unclassified Streptomyces]MCX5328669.1 hypothetical protein [Streptomyces sp. NBC_00140]MCX5358082.1 hypothetical protein [Streptomyces sp. NBC_00124]
MTGLPVAAALLIGTVEPLSIAAEKLSLHGVLWDRIGDINLNSVGHAVVGLLVVTWVAALPVWRNRRIEEKWALAPQVAAG